MKILKGKQRRYLAKEAHHLDPVVMIGQRGMTPTLMDAVNKALTDHELIKVKFQDFKDQKKEFAKTLCDSCDAQMIQMIGNVLTLYRYQEDPEKRQYSLPQ